MRCLKVGVRLVLSVPDPVVVEGANDRKRRVRAQRVRAPAFVDVVPEVHHGVDVLRDDVRVGVEVALRPVLARDESEAQGIGHLVEARRGTRAADGADLPSHLEAVEVLVTRSQSEELHTHAVRLVGERRDRAASDEPPEAVVAGDLVARDVGLRRHPAADDQRVGRQPGPQHDAARTWVARGDTEREGIPLDRGLGEGARAPGSGHGEPRDERSSRPEQRSPAHDVIPISGDAHATSPPSRHRHGQSTQAPGRA